MSSRRALIGIGDAKLRRAIVKLVTGTVEVVTCESLEAALSLAKTGRPDVAVLDASLAFEPLLAKALGGTPVVALGTIETGALSEEVVAAMPHPVDAEHAAFALVRALEVAELRSRAERAELRVGAELGEFVAASKGTRTLVAKARHAGGSRANTLVTGETGTGKELLARAALGALDAPVVDLALARDPSSEEERLLSLVGATRAERVLVLHVERLSREGQTHLLAALTKDAANDRAARIRVVATADSAIRTAVERGVFDRLLYLALSTVLVEVPALRARRDDIPVLSLYFLRRITPSARIGPAAMRALRAHAFPGNVIELEAAITHAAAIMQGDVVALADLPFAKTRPKSHPLADAPYASARERVIADFEHEYVEEMLSRSGGNLAQAARLAGMDRANFRRLYLRVKK